MLIGNLIGMVGSFFYALTEDGTFFFVGIVLLFSSILIGEMITLITNVKFLMKENSSITQQLTKLTRLSKDISNRLEIK
jgi:hypothetical protein